MKVILSRKGFDGSNGGMPSLIMPNGDMVSMPIPSPGDADAYDELFYGDHVALFPFRFVRTRSLEYGKMPHPERDGAKLKRVEVLKIFCAYSPDFSGLFVIPRFWINI